MNGTNACLAVTIGQSFIILSILKLVISTVSVLANSFILYLLVRSESFHSNVRLLLKNFTLSAILMSLGLAMKGIYNCYVWHVGLFPMEPWACSLSEIGWTIGGSAMTSAISWIGLERIITTIWKKTYSDGDRPSKLAYVLAVSCWMIGMGGFSMSILFSLLKRDPLCFCFGILVAPPLVSYLVIPLFLLMEIWTILCYLYLYCKSRSSYLDFTINTTQHSLAERYQLLNNIETTSLLAPIMMTHGIIYSGILCLITYIQAAVTDTATIMEISAYMLFVQGMEAILHPVLLLVKHKSMRKAAVKYYPFLKRFFEETEEKTTTVTKVNFRREEGASVVNEGPKHGRLGGQSGLVDFRVKPEDHDNILNTLWSQPSKRR